MIKMTYQWVLFALLAFWFIVPSSNLTAQTCGDRSSTVEVTLDSIQNVEVEDAKTSEEAKKAYEQGLADAAAEEGSASCSGSCTVGDCSMKFREYASGNRTPNPKVEDGVYIFPPPPGGELQFSVHCPCSINAAPDPSGSPGGGPGIGQTNDQLLRSTFGNATFSFYPNPADEIVNIDIDLPKASGQMILSIINLQGHVLTTKEVGNLGKGQHRFDLDIRALSPGLYFGLIHLDNEVVSQSRIVIQH